MKSPGPRSNAVDTYAASSRRTVVPRGTPPDRTLLAPRRLAEMTSLDLVRTGGAADRSWSRSDTTRTPATRTSRPTLPVYHQSRETLQLPTFQGKVRILGIYIHAESFTTSPATIPDEPQNGPAPDNVGPSIAGLPICVPRPAPAIDSSRRPDTRTDVFTFSQVVRENPIS